MSNLSFLFAYLVIAFAVTLLLVPSYLDLLKKCRIKKTIREEALIGKASKFHELHKHKTGTPTMGGGVILFTVFFLVSVSVLVRMFDANILQIFGFHSRFSLWNRNETYLALFTLFTVG